ncbi:MAG: hypothetical protein ACTSPR_04365 [Candidatus Thorarchaeota archaeon]
MAFTELWLEMRSSDNSFRVVLLTPVDFEMPAGFTLGDIQNFLPDKKLYYSEWVPSIAKAKESMDSASRFYHERAIHFLYFREIRPGQKKSGD